MNNLNLKYNFTEKDLQEISKYSTSGIEVIIRFVFTPYILFQFYSVGSLKGDILGALFYASFIIIPLEILIFVKNRRRRKKVTEQFLNRMDLGEYTISFQDEKISITVPSGKKIEKTWKEILQCKRRGQYIFLSVTTSLYFPIPLHAFSCEEEWENLLRESKNKIQKYNRDYDGLEIIPPPSTNKDVQNNPL